jgi:acyl-CoA synthetase
MTGALLTLLGTERLERHRKEGFWRDETLYALASAHARARPDHVAVRDRYRALSWAALVEAADRLAADLVRRGVRPGGRVPVWVPARVETAVVLLACSRNGFVCCPSLHRDHTVGDIVGLMRRMRASALVVQPGHGADADRHDILAQAAEVESLRHVYALPAAAETPLPFADLPAADVAPARQDPDRIAYLAFTSGTTGVPKGVMHSDNTLLANARAMSADWHFTAESVLYSMSPLSHNLGLGALICAILTGAELVLHDVPRGASLCDRLVETGATFLFGVPTHAVDLLAELRARQVDRVGRLEGFRISGAAASDTVIAGLMAHGVTPQAGYGMTETCSHQYTLPTDSAEMIRESSGRACPGYEIRIVEQDNPDQEAPIGSIGQIAGRGASLMLGYFDDQASTEDSFNREGWFLTGDLGWVDEKGYLRVTGRKKDLIIRGGHNIYPARIEALASRHPDVSKVAVFPVPDERLGERVCLAVVPREGAAPDAASLLHHLDEQGLSRYDMPEYVLQLSEMPLTASGKIFKRDLVQWVADGRVTPQPVRFQKTV